MPAYNDFEREIRSGKMKNIYFIAASDGYFTAKAGDVLKEKLFGSQDQNDNFFVLYGDENTAEEVVELCSNFSSLFAAKKAVIVKRAEKFSRKLGTILEYSKKPDPDTILLLIFDKDYVIEKKLNREVNFYDFSEMTEADFSEWITSEFTIRGCTAEDDALELLRSDLPRNFDLISSEIEKICGYIRGERDMRVTKEIVSRAIGYVTRYSPEELIYSIIRHDNSRSLEILDNLLNKESVNEIYLLSIISNYYLDMLSFKTRGLEKSENGALYGKYRMWGERLKFARNFNSLVDVKSLKYSLSRILETDQKLKSSMLDSKTLMASLVEDLVESVPFS